jgi:hypothetical protein
MTIDRFFNPVFIFRNRERIVPYLSRQTDPFVHYWTLRPFRNRHGGERCFIIGNGPSLAVADLEKLSSEVTFAANKVYLAFDQTDWRPSYYVLEDDQMIRQNHEVIQRLEGFQKFVSNRWKSLFRGSSDIVSYPRILLGDFNEFPKFSGNAYRKVYCGYMVTYISLQLAYFMGFTSVYLIGVDFHYSLIDQTSDTIEHAAHHPSDHFAPNYFEPGEQRNSPRLEFAERAMRCAKDFYEVHGRKIWNATRGGKLEVFDRITLEDALKR